jgi:hypothetical protein
MRTNDGVEIDGAITAGAKSFRLDWDHGELDAIPPKARLPTWL